MCRSPRFASRSSPGSDSCLTSVRFCSRTPDLKLFAGGASRIVSSAAFTFAFFLSSSRGEFLSLTGFGTNDAELAVDDTEVDGTIIG